MFSSLTENCEKQTNKKGGGYYIQNCNAITLDITCFIKTSAFYFKIWRYFLNIALKYDILKYNLFSFKLFNLNKMQKFWGFDFQKNNVEKQNMQTP